MHFWGVCFGFYITSPLSSKGLGSTDIQKTEISAQDLGKIYQRQKEKILWMFLLGAFYHHFHLVMNSNGHCKATGTGKPRSCLLQLRWFTRRRSGEAAHVCSHVPGKRTRAQLRIFCAKLASSRKGRHISEISGFILILLFQ